MKYIITIFICLSSCTLAHKVTKKAVVISHFTTSDKYGNAYCYTIFKCDDGTVVEKEGLSYFALNIGLNTEIEVYEP